MALRQLPAPKWTVPGNSGGVASGWKVHTYAPGTTTAKNTYTDSTGGTANANPVILDSRGEASIWWDGTYKVVVKDQNDVTKFTEDNYGEGLDPVALPQLSLVKNYSFETATVDANTPDNWTITLYTAGTQILDSSSGNQIHGAKSIKFTSAGTGGGYAESDLFPVQEAEALSVSFALKSSVADVRNLVEIVWHDRSESLLSTTSLYDNSTTNPTSWTDQDLSATPPSNARFAKLRLTGCHSSDSTVGSTWFDNVRAVAIGSISLPGVTFPATQVPSSDPNTLDDYEVGTFTPDLKFGGVAISTQGGIYGSRNGYYTKIGRLIYASMLFQLDDKGTGTGAATITALPFAAHTIVPLSVTASVVTNSGVIDARTGGGSTTIDLREYSTAGTISTLTDADFADNSQLYISGTYMLYVFPDYI